MCSPPMFVSCLCFFKAEWLTKTNDNHRDGPISRPSGPWPLHPVLWRSARGRPRRRVVDPRAPGRICRTSRKVGRHMSRLRWPYLFNLFQDAGQVPEINDSEPTAVSSLQKGCSHRVRALLPLYNSPFVWSLFCTVASTQRLSATLFFKQTCKIGKSETVMTGLAPAPPLVCAELYFLVICALPSEVQFPPTSPFCTSNSLCGDLGLVGKPRPCKGLMSKCWSQGLQFWVPALSGTCLVCISPYQKPPPSYHASFSFVHFSSLRRFWRYNASHPIQNRVH